ncbi:MAG TPA: hypothetical protein VN698_10695 [Bacteroidia bacterium]|nr:hypothetical protein [Bacteroidia bacterium]
METFVYQIRSAKGVHLKFVYQELTMLVEEHKVDNDSTIMQAVPAGDCVLLTTNNVKLVSALKKDADFILA